MVLVAGCAPIRREARDVVIDAASRMQRLTLDEPGCISYRFAFSLDEPDDLILIEEWRDGESLAAHLSTAHFTKFADVLRSALNGSPTFTRYDVASASPLFE
jgi:quinol monooxygenase YgiN